MGASELEGAAGALEEAATLIGSSDDAQEQPATEDLLGLSTRFENPSLPFPRAPAFVSASCYLADLRFVRS